LSAAATMAAAPKTVRDVPAQQFVVAYAQYLRSTGKVDVPTWADMVKTATWKELGPYDPDWYYIRCASMARHVYLKGGLGVGKFKHIYGGPSRRGTCPSHHKASSGSVARSCLKQLTRMGIIELHESGGRQITPSGQRDLDRIAGRCAAPEEEDDDEEEDDEEEEEDDE